MVEVCPTNSSHVLGRYLMHHKSGSKLTPGREFQCTKISLFLQVNEFLT